MVGVDVGSAEGMQPHWRAYEGLIDFYCFEPHETSSRSSPRRMRAIPSVKKFHVLPVGLSGAGASARCTCSIRPPEARSIPSTREGIRRCDATATSIRCARPVHGRAVSTM